MFVVVPEALVVTLLVSCDSVRVETFHKWAARCDPRDGLAMNNAIACPLITENPLSVHTHKHTHTPKTRFSVKFSTKIQISVT